jgi:TonB-linked SusC/RagA family outer membrane protein
MNFITPVTGISKLCLFKSKIFLVMQITTVLILAALMQVNAASYNKRITLNAKNAMVETVFQAIEQQSEFTFLYDKLDLKKAERITVSLKDASIEQVLQVCFKNQPLEYKIFEQTIVVKGRAQPVFKKSETDVSQPPLTVTGTVTDEKGETLPGVSVNIKGTSKVVLSDTNGDFRIVADNENAVLIFSYIGFKSKEVAAGKGGFLKVVLVADTKDLNEVVVTALGISRQKRSLGYATQQLSGEDVTTVKSDNIANSLSGKVAGVQIKRNTNMGGSTNVLIRGNNSLTGNNQALFVVDGVPIDNSNFNTSGQQGAGGGFDYGNMASDINPDDVESINVLKGAAATALYGSRATNGAIIITTKKGAKNDKMDIAVNSGVTVGFIDKSTFPTYQNKYGVGYGQVFGVNGNSFFDQRDVNGDGVLDLVAPLAYGSYGAPFDPNLMVYQWDSVDPESPNYLKPTPWVSPKNGPIEFFETPVSTTNNISMSGSTDKASYRLSYTNFWQKGILPNGDMKRSNFTINTSFKINKRLTASGSANYVITDATGRNETGNESGSNGGNVVSYFRRYWVTNVDIKQQKDIYFQTKRNVTGIPGGTIDNPYWTRYENNQSDNRKRLFGNMALNYVVTDWLNVEGRVSTDTYSYLQEERTNNGTLNAVGRYIRNNINFTETNYDLMVNFNKQIVEKLSVSGVLGTNIRRNDLNSIRAVTNGGLILDRLYSISNSKDAPAAPTEVYERIGVDGYYGSVSFGYNNMFYVDVTGRSDHSSTLPVNNSTYFYPSVATSFIFSELLKGTAVSLGKLRLNYAEVGSSAPANSLTDVLAKPTPFGSVPLYTVNSTKNNVNLKPENTVSLEAGLEMSFFGRRLGFDISAYKTNSKDQIMPVAISGTTGYSSKFVNAGEIENKGLEVVLTGSPVRKADFGWDVNINWAKNKGTVLSLFEGVDNLQLGSLGGVTLNARPGEPYGLLQGTDFIYVNGQRQINQVTGEYMRTTSSNNIIGNITPDWNAGINNKFNYKSFNLSFLIDIQKGGDVFSNDISVGNRSGLYDYTAGNNELGNPIRNSLANGGGIILEGVDAAGNPNKIRTPMDNYTNALGSVKAPQAYFIYDASYVKLREVALSYNFPARLFQNFKIKGAQVSLIGSNLWIIHKNLPFADPESNLSSGNLQGSQTGVLPSTRTIGFNLKLQL